MAIATFFLKKKTAGRGRARTVPCRTGAGVP